jgi:glutaminase
VMGSCGMYDFAGEWIYNIGMPAKSGVAGGIIAVLPGQLGIGVFSPPLDARGNSVRGIRVCDALSRHCDLHLFNRPSVGTSAIRLTSTAAELSSNRVRTPEESQVLHAVGNQIRIYQLQGDLTFASTEPVVQDVIEKNDDIQHLIVDLKCVLTINESACRLFYEVLRKLSCLNKSVVFTHAERLPLLRQYLRTKLGARCHELFRSLADNDLALEWCENRVLEAALIDRGTDVVVEHSRYELFEKFVAEEIAVIASLLRQKTFQQGETIIHAGDDASEMFFLARGSVSVFIPLETGGRKRLATFSAGMIFGEMAIIDRAPRSAMILADSQVICDALSVDDFDRLGGTHPAIKIKLLEGLSLCLCQRLRTANRKLSVFD